MSDLGFNVWGTIAGVIGALALIPVFLAWLQTRLPTTRISEVVAIHKEVKELFSASLEEGLITDSNELLLFKINLIEAAACIDELRAEVYAIKTWRQNVAKWWSGLSGKIAVLCEKLNVHRMKLATRNSNERKKQASQKSVEDLSLPLHVDYYRGNLPDGLRHWAKYSHRPTAMRDGALAASLAQSALSFADVQSASAHSGGPLVHERRDDARERSSASSSISEDDGDSDRDQCPSEPSRLSSDIAGSTRHLISATDLHSLLSLAVTGPPRWSRRTPRMRMMGGKPGPLPRSRQKQPGSATHPDTGRRDGTKKRDGLHPRVQALVGIVRRAYGVHLGVIDVGGGSNAQGIPIDPESLTPHFAGGSTLDSDSDEWEDD
ncbi:hypothetical protein FKP32DRAFT_1587194 [Trametes sanguinea]|nr:hypothetical protein FKP32DRAFT_1587194 [Trametes sanguinea]